MRCTSLKHPLVIFAVLLTVCDMSFAQDSTFKASSYSSIVINEDFAKTMTRMKAAKPDIMKRQMDLLNARYDLSDHPANGVTMSRGKPVQEGVRIKLAKDLSWGKLATLSPEEIRENGLFPVGFLPLPHPNHPEGGMVFPKFFIQEIKKQEGRDLVSFDLDFDLLINFCRSSPLRST